MLKFYMSKYLLILKFSTKFQFPALFLSFVLASQNCQMFVHYNIGEKEWVLVYEIVSLPLIC